MLYQPTNIYPDLRAGNGNGTVDVTQDLAVTWEVNGSSPLSVYYVSFYRNDAESTVIFEDTEGSKLRHPFYGTDNRGNKIPFSVTFTKKRLAELGLANGNEYKLEIKQKWIESDGSTSTNAVSTVVAFNTRTLPSITCTNNLAEVNHRDFRFDFSYTQEQNDALQWIRYVIAYDSDPGRANPIYDSGRIYGTAETYVVYDGFLPGIGYCINCMICTENGIQTETGWLAFMPDYERILLDFRISATPLCSECGIRVSWDGTDYILGTPTGDYFIRDQDLVLPTGDDSVRWDSVSEAEMSIEPEWSILYRGYLKYESVTLWTIGTNKEAYNITFSYDREAASLILKVDGTALATVTDIANDAKVATVLTPKHFYVRVEQIKGRLYPSETLLPLDDLYPKGGQGIDTTISEFDVSYTQYAISSFTLSGPQQCDYLVEISGTESDKQVLDAIEWSIRHNSYVPEFSDATHFFATFQNGLQAGSMYVIGEQFAGWAVYRTENGAGISKLLARLPISAKSFIDYGARTDGTVYSYSVAPVFRSTIVDPEHIIDGLLPEKTLYPARTLYPSDGGTNASHALYNAVTGVAISTGDVRLCLWDYVLLECAYDADLNCYPPVAIYKFGKNLSSGTLSNNNTPSVLLNFTEYPTVQLSPTMYQSGSLESLIGSVGFENGDFRYRDTRQMRDAIWALSKTTNHLFLKTRKGDVLKVRVTTPIQFSTMDGTREQALSVSLSWAEVENANDMSLLRYSTGSALGDIPSDNTVSQGAFANIQVGTKTVAADQVADTLTLIAGNNVTLQPDIVSDAVTIGTDLTEITDEDIDKIVV